jgi:hypothetical protein
LNTFIKKGLRRNQSPETDDNQYIDYHDHYHIHDEGERVTPNVYAYGFVVQTKTPGSYPVVIQIITDCGEAVPAKRLSLVVEHRDHSAAS